jgi:hypothetical protein
MRRQAVGGRWSSAWAALHSVRGNSQRGISLRLEPLETRNMLSTVMARQIFYNQSAFDGNDPGIDAADDGAIAIDKTPYRPELAFTIRQLTTNNTFDSNPQVFGSQVIWQGRGGTDGGTDDEIFYFDSLTTTQLTANTATDRFPELSNLGLVWERGSGTAQEIIFSDSVTETPLTANSVFDGNASLSETRLAWEQGAGNGIEIMSWDGVTISNLSQNATVDRLPSASGNRVGWVSGSTPVAQVKLFDGANLTTVSNPTSYALDNVTTSSQWVAWEGFPTILPNPLVTDREIYLYNGTTTTRITNNSFSDFAPQASGQNLVWWGGVFNNFQVYRFDGSTVTQLSTGIRNRFPQVDGDNIVWQGYDGHDEEIFFSNGQDVIQLTHNEYDDTSPQVSGNHVVWQGQFGSDGTTQEIFDAFIGQGPADFANVTSYTRGINGIMIDLGGGGDHASINADDFIFKIGNDNAPSGWAAVTATPTISVRTGAGVSGSDRVTITWASGSIRNTWLEVQVLPTPNTGLTATDVHFWGNKIGDTGQGTPPTTFLTSGADKTSVLGLLGSGVGITSIRDFNRDNNVTAADASVVPPSLGSIVRLTVGAGGPFAPEGSEAEIAAAEGDAGIASALAVSGSSLLPMGAANATASAWHSHPPTPVPSPLAIAILEAQRAAGAPRDLVLQDNRSFDDEVWEVLIEDISADLATSK